MADYSKRYAGKVAVITGGATGLGRGIADRLASEGAKVLIWDFNETLGAAAEAEIKGTGADASFCKVDVSQEDSVKAGFEHAIATYSRCDVVVNCAGIVGPTKIKTAEIDTADFDRVYNVNLRGSFLVTKYAIPHMLKNDYGRILLIASIAGKEGNAGMAAYSMSKAGVIGFVKAAGKEYAETNITINGLAPAVVRTQMVANMEPEQVKYMTDKIPMKRCGTIEEVAATAAFITSEEATFNTGYCFDLTGGRAVY
jgi:3-oxoacyl-[acyl-carrier protein] reductase